MKGFINLGKYRGGAFTQLTHTCNEFLFYKGVFSFTSKIFRKNGVLYNELGRELIPLAIAQLFKRATFFRLPNNGIFKRDFRKRFSRPILFSLDFIVRFNRVSVQNSFQFNEVRSRTTRKTLLMHYNLGDTKPLPIDSSNQRVYIGGITRKKNLEGIRVDALIGSISDMTYRTLLVESGMNLLGEKSRLELLEYITLNRPQICSNSMYEGWPNVIFDAVNAGCYIEFNENVHLVDLFYRVPNVIFRHGGVINYKVHEKYISSITKARLNGWYREAGDGSV